jgi:hypothetical protein
VVRPKAGEDGSADLLSAAIYQGLSLFVLAHHPR